MRFSEAFGLRKSQWELDFVDVDLALDTALFLDPFALAQRVEPWAVESHQLLSGFFQTVLDRLRAGDVDEARELLDHLHEPNETRLGLSRGKPQGAGIGKLQAGKLIAALAKSSAFRTGSLAHLEECELWIDSISHDKISDLATNVLRARLAKYTFDQCSLHGVATRSAPLPAYYDPDSQQWRADYFELPVHNNAPVLLVPKVIVRYKPAYRASEYYNVDVLEFLQAEHTAAGSLRRSLRKTKPISKKALKVLHPCTKEFLAEFSRDHPEVLKSYRARLARREMNPESAWNEDEEFAIAEALITALRGVKKGPDHAGTYHSLMVGVVQLLLHPHIVNPRKETPIHEGRKRIDITVENAARDGFLHRLATVACIPCSYLYFECKNYTHDLKNPELDQMIGRFSDRHGKVGFIFCRSFDDRDLFVKRCRDTYNAGQGVIIAMDDELVVKCLQHIESGERHLLDQLFTSLIDAVRLG